MVSVEFKMYLLFMPITDELADFLDMPRGIEIARIHVLRQITTYIRANSLSNRRNITPDAKLMDLLKIPDGEILTYYNLQKYISPHFYKNVISKNIQDDCTESETISLQEIKEMREEMKQIREEMKQLYKFRKIDKP